MRIANYISEEEAEFFRTYAEHAIANKSKQVSLFTKKEGRTKVDRAYYSVNSAFWLFDKIRKTAEDNWKVPITFREDAYAHIMHYKTGSKGLGWHADRNLGWVSASINITPEYMHEGGEFEIWNSKISCPYRSLVMYDKSVKHRVTGVSGGEKMSLVLWLPKVGQEVSKGQAWRYK